MKEVFYMTNLKEQAVIMLQNVPDDKMIYVIDILKQLNNIFDSKNVNINKKSMAVEAWEELKKYQGIIDCDIDAKAELAKARDEKYADFN